MVLGCKGLLIEYLPDTQLCCQAIFEIQAFDYIDSEQTGAESAGSRQREDRLTPAMAAIDLNKAKHHSPSFWAPAKTQRGLLDWGDEVAMFHPSPLAAVSGHHRGNRCRTGHNIVAMWSITIYHTLMSQMEPSAQPKPLLALPLTTPTETDVHSHVS